MSYDSSDPKSVEKATKDFKTKEVLRQEGLRQLLATEPGRAWLHGLLKSTGPFRSSFSTDPISMAYNCGETNVGLRLITEVHACSTELYLVMMKENQDA